MACLLTGGFTKADCGYLLGGLKTLYLANYDEVVSIEDTPTLDGILDTITMEVGKVFYKLEFERDSASFTQELQISSGNKYVTQTLTFSLAGQGTDVLSIIDELSLGKFIAIAETRKGVRTILGLSEGLEAISGTNANSGAASGDFGGAVIVLSTDEAGYGQEFDSTGTIPLV